MPSKKTWLKFMVGGVAVLLLLLPSLVTAIVWTTINLYITVLAIAATLLAAHFFPKVRWFFATVTVALIALPPYPNWIFWSDKDGWFLWLGPSLRSLEVGANIIFFMVALLPFVAIFWATGARASQSHSA